MVRLVAESISLSEIASRLGSLKRYINESLSLSETVTKLGSLSRYANETIQLPETIASGFMAMVRIANESISIQSFDGLKARVMVRVINEIIQIPTLAINQFYSMVQIVSESLGISDLPTRFGAMKRIVSETLSLPELVKTPLSLVIKINEQVAIGLVAHGQMAFSHIGEAIAFVLHGLVTIGGGIMRTGDKIKTVRTTDKSKTVRGN